MPATLGSAFAYVMGAVGHRIRRTHQLSLALFAEEAGEFGVTTVQYAALAAIAAREDIDATRLAALVAFDRSTVGAVLERLEAKGLIDRHFGPDDKRIKLLRVTPREASYSSQQMQQSIVRKIVFLRSSMETNEQRSCSSWKNSSAGTRSAIMVSRFAADRPDTIDVHHHFEPTGKNAGGKAWSIEMSLEHMDRNGVRAAIGYAGPVFGDATTPAQRQAREANEWAADLCRTFPGRFGLFASIPFDDVEAAQAEIAHAFDTLSADGIGLAPRYGTAWLGDAKFRPIFEELDRRHAVVYVHPHRSSSCDAIATLNTTDRVIAAAWIEYPTDTARTILSLWSAGVTRDFPNIRFLFCHGGGVLPILLGRFAGFADWHAVGPDRLAAIFPDGVYAEFAKLYFECAQALAPETVTMLRSLAPASHILFGTDFSYFPIAHSVAEFNALNLPPDVYRAIACDNAMALLPRWKR